MNCGAAIEANREALKRVLAMLVAMAGLEQFQQKCAAVLRPELRENNEIEHSGDSAIAGNALGDGAATLPRHLHRAVLRLLRPAESAARRLVIAAARGLVVKLPPPRKPKPKTMEPLLRSLGIAVVISPADLPGAATAARRAAPAARPRALRLPLFDPLPRLLSLSKGRRRYVPAHAAPRILFPGVTQPFSLPPPPSPDDPIDAARLSLRLAALAAALDDLPKHARRFARWKAARAAAGAQRRPAPGRIRRISPLRPGRPPGGRLSRYDPTATHPRNIREVDEILAHAHALAIYAPEASDTS
jgi:hypothetical protein